MTLVLKARTFKVPAAARPSKVQPAVHTVYRIPALLRCLSGLQTRTCTSSPYNNLHSSPFYYTRNSKLRALVQPAYAVHVGGAAGHGALPGAGHMWEQAGVAEGVAGGGGHRGVGARLQLLEAVSQDWGFDVEEGEVMRGMLAELRRLCWWSKQGQRAGLGAGF